MSTLDTLFPEIEAVLNEGLGHAAVSSACAHCGRRIERGMTYHPRCLHEIRQRQNDIHAERVIAERAGSFSAARSAPLSHVAPPLRRAQVGRDDHGLRPTSSSRGVA
jgi:hypothetical protein